MTHHSRLVALLIVLLVALAAPVSSGFPEAAASTAAPDLKVLQVLETLAGEPRVKEALAFIEADHARRVAETLELVQVPAPPFNEHHRAEAFARFLEDLGLDDVHIDEEGNVLGYFRGASRRPKLVLSAHLDTVFPLGYDPTPRIDDQGVIHAPGIGDDAAGLTALLAVARALRASGVATVGDILFVGTVGEEAVGDLRGVRYLFQTHRDIDGFITVDLSPAGRRDPEPWPIYYNALGSRRFEFRFRGPGGHSFFDFGTPSAVHALARAVTLIADMEVPDEPKTTFTASVIQGGSSVTAIAAEAVLQTDIRSASPQQLDVTAAELMARVTLGVAEENARWGRWEVTVESVLLGDRPSGFQRPDSPVVQAAIAAATVLPGLEPAPTPEPVGTDANLPIFLGVPSASVSRGGINRNFHSLAETWDPDGAWRAVQSVFLTVLGLVGVQGLTDPLLPEHPGYSYHFDGLREIPEMYRAPGQEYRFSWIR